MIIKSVTFNNFKPYYQTNSIVLSPEMEKGQNVILIGGRNGQGKTSFLVGIVWCLYGRNMSQVDQIFQKEVRNNYTHWLRRALNWTAKKENDTVFSIEIVLGNVELSDTFYTNEQVTSEISLKRVVDIKDSSYGETFTILIDGVENGLLKDESEQINFINDYIIPIDIAKFVFFDAEKIAEIASLNTRERALLMDKSFGQVLGLNTYEELILDIKKYVSDLKRQEVSTVLESEIASYEGARNSNNKMLENIEEKLNDNENRLDELKIEITDITNQLIKRGNVSIKTNLKELQFIEEKLNVNIEKAKETFHELSDLIPFAIIGFKLEEVQEQLKIEKENEKRTLTNDTLRDKTKEFAEELFNRPPYPEEDLMEDIDMDQKSFYAKKARNLLTKLYTNDTEIEPLPFEHEFDKSEINHMNLVCDLVSNKTKQSFEHVFNDYLRIQNDLQEVQKDIRLTEIRNNDEFIQDFQDKKKEVEKEQEGLIELRGKLQNEQEKLKNENEKHKTNIERLLNRVKTSKKIEKKILVAKKYIKVLEEFVKLQKEEKRQILENAVITEIKKLLDKPKLVETVNMTFLKLRDNYGLEVKLFNDEGLETNPNNDMSKGEQQIYVSALIKAIFSESIHNLPVLIDTPLGRLDQEHRDNILKSYYPSLADQVIIFSTNTEIRVSDLPKIEQCIARKYRLINENKQTIIKPEYFN